MAYNNARKKATMNYINNNLDTISFRLPKEKKDDKPTKEEIKAHCDKYGYSIQAFIIKAIKTQMMIDNHETIHIPLDEVRKKDK